MHPNPNRTPPAATVDIGYGPGAACGLYGRPSAAVVTRPGAVTLVLGRMASGRMLTVTTTSLQWLDQLESAIQAARAAAIVEAGMTLAVAEPESYTVRTWHDQVTGRNDQDWAVTR